MKLYRNFTHGFAQYKADVIAECVLPEVRSTAGFKDSSRFITANCSESLNHVIKQEVEWKEMKLHHLIERLKAIVDDQMSSFQKAIVSRGEWAFPEAHEECFRVTLVLNDTQCEGKTLQKKSKSLTG